MLVTLLAACSTGLKGSGTHAESPREVEQFSALTVKGGFEVTVSIGDEHSVVLDGDDNILDVITTTVEDGRLNVETTEKINPDLPLRLTVTSPVLTDMSVEGAAEVSLSGLAGDTFGFSCDGACDATISGSTTALNLSLSGAANLNTRDLEAQDVTISVDGAADVTVCANQSLTATLSGAGAVHYACEPENVSQTVRGAGTIEPID